LAGEKWGADGYRAAQTSATATAAPEAIEELPVEIHKPKPVHNWREFLKEYAIIVLGVLTALAGEEIVIGLHHHYQVADLRTALHRELAWDMVAMKAAVDEQPCVEARMKEIEAWAASLQGPASQQLKIRMTSPGFVFFRTSTWRSAAGGTLDNLPLDERIAYAQFYDGVDNNNRIRDDGINGLRDLRDFQDARALSTEDARRISHDIREVRSAFRTLASNYRNWTHLYAPATGVKIEEAPPRFAGAAEQKASQEAFCKTSIQTDRDQ
jgi:hypothetical protein